MCIRDRIYSQCNCNVHVLAGRIYTNCLGACIRLHCAFIIASLEGRKLCTCEVVAQSFFNCFTIPGAAEECTQLAFGKQVDCLTCFFVGLVCEFRICSKVNQVIGYCKTLFVIEITGRRKMCIRDRTKMWDGSA